MFKKLDLLGEEYFYQFIEEVRPVPLRKYRHLMWGSLYAIAFFEVFALVGISASPSAASHVRVINYVMLAIFGCYGLLVVVAGVGRLPEKHYTFRVWLQLIQIWCLQLSIWAMMTTLACTQAAADFYLVIFLLNLVFGVFLNIRIIGLERDKVAKGYYRKGDCGILGVHSTRAKKMLGPLEGLSPGWIAAVVAGWGLLFARARPDEAGTPLWALIALPLLPLILFVILSPVTSGSLIQIYIYRRFGTEAQTSASDCASRQKQKDEK
jgi:hypothetical protein